VEFPTEVTGDTLRRFEEREWTAAVNAMRSFFAPRAVAVIGASRRKGSIGGAIAFMLQSGALGLAIMDYAGALGLGLSTFASVGNKADISISGNDLIRFWGQDAGTDVILLYLESFGNPRKFSRIARRVAQEKPIVAVKSGRSLTGARAAGSHTGALLAASDVTIDALFRHSAVIRTDTLREMFDVASLLIAQPAPRGAASASSPTPGGPPSSAPTPARRRGWRSRSSLTPRWRRSVRSSPPRVPPPTRST
jgi:acyl-CoA synthetase (NDP forming)